MALHWPVLTEPQWLWLWPVIVAVMLISQRADSQLPIYQQIQLVHPFLKGEMHGARQHRLFTLNSVFCLLASGCFVLALSRPQTISEAQPLPPEGREFVLLVDNSLSMGVGDFSAAGREVRRIDVLKVVVSRFINQRQHDHFSLITFSSQAATLVPMTYDRQLVIRQLQRLKLGLLGDGTSIGQALALAVKNIHADRQHHAVFILFSDGENTSGELLPRDALILARDRGARIYSVEVSGAAEQAIQQDAQPGLRELAAYSGGQYYHAADSQGLQNIIDDVDQLEKYVGEEKTRPQVNEWYPWLLLLGAAGLLLSRVLEYLREQR